VSFRCERCGKVQPAHAKPHRIVTETRERVYPEIADDNDPSIVLQPEGRGWEVVKEIEVCERCFSDRD
jgi:hypothetical protein